MVVYMPNKPIAKKVPHLSHHHGDQRIDDYYWLRDDNWPNVNKADVIEYLNQENEYFHSIMDPLKVREDEIYNELVARIKLEDSTVPVKDGDYYYYSRTTKESNYSIFARKKSSLNAKEEIILDVNELAKGTAFFNLGAISISPDHSKLAYSSDTNGKEVYVAVVKDLATGLLLEDKVDHIFGDIVWHENGKGFFYAKLNESWRCDQIFYHELGTKQASDKLVFKEHDSLFQVGVGKTSSKQYVVIDASSKDSNEVHLIAMSDASMKLTVIAERREMHLYGVAHHDQFFYILTNDKGKNFRLVKTLNTEPAEKYWQEVIGHDPKIYLSGFELYKDYFSVSTKENGLPKIKIFNYHTQDAKLIDFPDAAYHASTIFTTFESPNLRLAYSSLNTPSTVMEYEVVSGELKTLKETEVLGGFNKDLYKTERIFIASNDGTKVPVSLVYKKELFNKDGKNPLYLYGYGSYGISRSPSFVSSIISLLDRGFVYAIAHIRGGDDLGYEWYESAKFLTKQRTFDDFISCAEELIKAKYTSKGNIVIVGGSAGGMLVGNVVNAKPELFKAVVAKVPFVDVLNTMLDESLPLTPGEFKEWGNPKSKEYYDYIKSYSPYDNVKAQNYPAIYVTAGISDPRVTYWEPAKWVAKLRDHKTDDNLLLFETNMDAGHQGASGRFGYLRDVAKEYNFIFKVFAE